MAALFGWDPGTVVLDQDVDLGSLGFDRDEHPSAAIFRGIVDEVAEHLVQILALDPNLGLMIAGDIDGDTFVKAVDGALNRLEALPHARARLRRRATADGAGSGEVVIDLTAHDQRFSDYGFVQVR